MPRKKGNKAANSAPTTTTPEPSVVDVQQVVAPTTSSEEGDSEKLKKAVEEILKSLAASEAKYNGPQERYEADQARKKLAINPKDENLRADYLGKLYKYIESTKQTKPQSQSAKIAGLIKQTETIMETILLSKIQVKDLCSCLTHFKAAYDTLVNNLKKAGRKIDSDSDRIINNLLEKGQKYLTDITDHDSEYQAFKHGLQLLKAKETLQEDLTGMSEKIEIQQNHWNSMLLKGLGLQIGAQLYNANVLTLLANAEKTLEFFNQLNSSAKEFNEFRDISKLRSIEALKVIHKKIELLQKDLESIQAEVLAETQVSYLSDVATTTDSGLSTSTTTPNGQPVGAVSDEEEICSTEEDDDEEYEKGTTTEEDDSEAEDEEVGASSSGDKPDDHPDSAGGTISYGFVNDEPEIFNIVSFDNSTDLSQIDDQGAKASRQAVENELNSEASVIAMPKHLNTEDVYQGDYNLGILNLPVLFGSAAAMASVFFHQEDHSNLDSQGGLFTVGAVALIALHELL